MQHNNDNNDNISGNDNTSSQTMRFQNAVWPESLPHANEEHIFTLLCGNTHVNWSLHMGAKHKFAAKLHWRYVICVFIYVIIIVWLELRVNNMTNPKTVQCTHVIHRLIHSTFVSLLNNLSERPHSPRTAIARIPATSWPILYPNQRKTFSLASIVI